MKKPFMRFEYGVWICRSERADCAFLATSANPFSAFIGWAEVNYARLPK